MHQKCHTVTDKRVEEWRMWEEMESEGFVAILLRIERPREECMR